MAPTCTAMPKAWLGLAEWDASVARVCAWCADKAQAEAQAQSLGMTMTHGMCDDCGAAQLSELLSLATK